MRETRPAKAECKEEEKDGEGGERSSEEQRVMGRVWSQTSKEPICQKCSCSPSTETKPGAFHIEKQVHKWFGETSGNLFTYLLICLKNERKKESAQHPSSTLNLTPKASRRARERSRWLFLSTWPQEVRREGHLPGYVSVTSKKEERRDTWSESDKSVRRHIYTAGEKESGSGMSMRTCFKEATRCLLLSDDGRSCLWQHRGNSVCCGIYCCKFEYFKNPEGKLLLMSDKHILRCSAQPTTWGQGWHIFNSDGIFPGMLRGLGQTRFLFAFVHICSTA